MKINEARIGKQNKIEGFTAESFNKHRIIENNSQLFLSSKLQKGGKGFEDNYTLTLNVHLKVMISNDRPSTDEQVEVKSKTEFIVDCDVDTETDETTLEIITKMYTTAVNYNLALFANDRNRIGKYERFKMYNDKEMLEEIKQGVFDLPTLN